MRADTRRDLAACTSASTRTRACRRPVRRHPSVVQTLLAQFQPRGSELITVEAELERLEAKVISAEQQDDDGGEAPTLQRASYVDDQIIAELAWNYETGNADFIVYDRHTYELRRQDAVETPEGLIVPPSFCTGVVTPGCGIPGCVLVPTERTSSATRMMEKGLYLIVNLL